MLYIKFMLKGLFVLKISKFLSRLFCHVRKWLDQKDKVNLRNYGITTWLTKNAIHILTNISCSNGNGI